MDRENKYVYRWNLWSVKNKENGVWVWRIGNRVWYFRWRLSVVGLYLCVVCKKRKELVELNVVMIKLLIYCWDFFW